MNILCSLCLDLFLKEKGREGKGEEGRSVASTVDSTKTIHLLGQARVGVMVSVISFCLGYLYLILECLVQILATPLSFLCVPLKAADDGSVWEILI